MCIYIYIYMYVPGRGPPLLPPCGGGVGGWDWWLRGLDTWLLRGSMGNLPRNL